MMQSKLNYFVLMHLGLTAENQDFESPQNCRGFMKGKVFKNCFRKFYTSFKQRNMCLTALLNFTLILPLLHKKDC